MKTVSRFEANLLRILSGFFGQITQDQLLKLVETEMDCPRCLSRNAVELAKDMLRKGVPMSLSRRGGWRRERHLRHEQIAEGRLWNRTPPRELGLSFSRPTLWLLLWLTGQNPNRSRLEPMPEDSELTMGDRLLYFLAYESFRGTEIAQGLLEQAPFREHAMIWLCYPSDLLEAEEPDTWDFSPWMTGQGGDIFESLQTHLAHRWLQMERQKMRFHLPDRMKRIGHLQQRVLDSLFNAAESAGRKDLCRFFLVAMNQFLKELAAVTSSGQATRLYHLDMARLRLAERAEVYQSAACCFREMRRMDQWNRLARATGFIDEGYAGSQLWKADWERLDGDQLCAQSQAQLNSLDPMSAGNPSAGASPIDEAGGTGASTAT